MIYLTVNQIEKIEISPINQDSTTENYFFSITFYDRKGNSYKFYFISDNPFALMMINFDKYLQTFENIIDKFPNREYFEKSRKKLLESATQEKFKMKLKYRKGSYQISIPAKIVKAIGFTKELLQKTGCFVDVFLENPQEKIIKLKINEEIQNLKERR